VFRKDNQSEPMSESYVSDPAPNLVPRLSMTVLSPSQPNHRTPYTC
jgi:hypothetical protein